MSELLCTMIGYLPFVIGFFEISFSGHSFSCQNENHYACAMGNTIGACALLSLHV